MKTGQGYAQQAVVGLSPCLCGCGRMVVKTKNRNGRVKEFFSDKCRTAVNTRAQRIGRDMLRNDVPAEAVNRAVERAALLPVRRKRQEHVDLERMTPQERLGALCRAAERAGVLPRKSPRAQS